MTLLFFFIIRREHDEKHNFVDQLKTIVPNVKIIFADGLTEGAACTVLLAEPHLAPDIPMLIVNSDQFVEWDCEDYAKHLKKCIENNHHDILCFTKPISENDTKWSYAKLNDRKFVIEVREKEVISEHATVGIYFWSHASDFVKAAHSMINANDRVKGEFYVCPVYNYNVQMGDKTTIYTCRRMWGLGVPDDLNYFLTNYEISL